MQYFMGFLGVVGGFFYIKYAYQISNFTGSIGFAERFLGGGGTYIFHKVMGVLIIMLSIMYAFGGLQSLLAGTLGKFT